MSVQAYGISVKLAELLGIGVSAYMSGWIASISVMTIPSLCLPSCPPTIAAKQWMALYDLGKYLGPLFSVLGGSAYIFLAFATSGKTAYAFGAAAVATLLVAPWTSVTMMPTNNKLIAYANGELFAKTGEAAEEELKKLLKTWGKLNAVRGVFPAIGAIIGFSVLLGWL